MNPAKLKLATVGAILLFSGISPTMSQTRYTASKTIHNTDSCAQQKIGEEPQQACPLLRTGMAQRESVGEIFDKSKSVFKPISLKCPAGNSGVLEEMRKNAEGLISKTHFIYRNGIIIRIIAEGALPGKNFEHIADYDLIKPQDHIVADEGAKAVAVISKVNDRICNGPIEMRVRYDAFLEANRKEFSSAKRAGCHSVK